MRFELGKLELFGLDVGGLWQRWWAGLNSLSPVPLADVFLRPAPGLTVCMGDERITINTELWQQPSRQLAALGYPEFDVLDDNSLHEQLIAGVGKNKKQLQLNLQLPEQQVLRRRISVPLTAKHNLRQVLAFQISRLTPFTQEQVYFDAIECSTDSAAGMLEAELVLVPKSFANKWLEQIPRVTGLAVARLQVPVMKGEINRTNLLGSLGVPSGWCKRLNINSFLVLLLALSIGVAMVAPVVKLRMLVMQNKHEIITLDHKVSEARTNWYDLQQNIANIELLLQQSTQHGQLDIVLDELSRLIPDTIFLTSMTLDKRRLEISGLGTGAVDLIAVLNASELFEQAKFSSAVTRGHNNLDVFTITMQLVTEGGRS